MFPHVLFPAVLFAGPLYAPLAGPVTPLSALTIGDLITVAADVTGTFLDIDPTQTVTADA